jgi:hypothetical protein
MRSDQPTDEQVGEQVDKVSPDALPDHPTRLHASWRSSAGMVGESQDARAGAGALTIAATPSRIRNPQHRAGSQDQQPGRPDTAATRLVRHAAAESPSSVTGKEVQAVGCTERPADPAATRLTLSHEPSETGAMTQASLEIRLAFGRRRWTLDRGPPPLLERDRRMPRPARGAAHARH